MPDHPTTTPKLTFGHLEQLTSQLLDGVIILDTAGTILSANAAALRMHGVQTAGDLGATADEYARRFNLFSADHRALKRREYPIFRLLAGDSFPDLVVEVAPAGEQEARWVHQVRDVAMDDDGDEPDMLALVINDISERFDAEARFHAMFSANPAPALVVRLSDMRVTQVNDGFVSLTGFKAEELQGRTLFGLDLILDVEASGTIRKQMEAGQVIPQTEAHLLTRDGSKRLVIFAGQPIDVTDDDALLLTFADLEPRRLAETALSASERHLATLFEMAPVAMAVARSGDQAITSVNAAFCHLTGLDADRVVGSTIAALEIWNDADEGASVSVEVTKKGQLRSADARLRSQLGDTIDCLVSAETITVHATPSTLWLFQDITERRRSELELIEAIDEVMKDASWLSQSIVEKLASIRRPGAAAPTADLSPREREMLELICEDLDDAAIAARLGLSRNTVRNHVARLYAKIGVNRRSGAVVWGRERGVGGSNQAKPGRA
jgi:PAS domain S-box-containing protein